MKEELKEIWYESGAWKRYNFYDFVKAIVELMEKKHATTKSLFD